MTVTVKDGRVSFRLDDILDGMTADEKMEVADALGCDSQVIKFVAQQILDGMTELGSYGSTGMASDVPFCGLDWATREVAKRSGEVAAREIERLERRVKFEREQYSRVLDELHSLQNKMRG